MQSCRLDLCPTETSLLYLSVQKISKFQMYLGLTECLSMFLTYVFLIHTMRFHAFKPTFIRLNLYNYFPLDFKVFIQGTNTDFQS